MTEYLIPFQKVPVNAKWARTTNQNGIGWMDALPTIPPMEVLELMNGSVYSSYASTFNEQTVRHTNIKRGNRMARGRPEGGVDCSDLISNLFFLLALVCAAFAALVTFLGENGIQAVLVAAAVPLIMCGGIGAAIRLLATDDDPVPIPSVQSTRDEYMNSVSHIFMAWSREVGRGAKFEYREGAGVLVRWEAEEESDNSNGNLLGADKPARRRRRSKSPAGGRSKSPAGGKRKKSRSRSRSRTRGADAE